MKRLAILAACLLAPCFQAYAADSYTIDPKHSFVMWRISHFDFSHPMGKWFARGDINMDDQDPKNDKVKADFRMADIDTGLCDLNAHLKGPEFFDVDKYPTASFVSDKVDIVNGMPSKVYGTLTVRGVSKPVTLHVTHSKKGTNPINNNETVGFSATAKVKRSDFGLTALLPGLGDDVDLFIEVEGFKPSSATAKP